MKAVQDYYTAASNSTETGDKYKRQIMKYKKVSIGICISLLLMISIYVYYTIIIKIRPFPEDGDMSLSGCYVTKCYDVEWDDSWIINWIYYYPSFVKVFDAKTKKCIYTSDMMEFVYLRCLNLQILQVMDFMILELNVIKSLFPLKNFLQIFDGVHYSKENIKNISKLLSCKKYIYQDEEYFSNTILLFATY